MLKPGFFDHRKQARQNEEDLILFERFRAGAGQVGDANEVSSLLSKDALAMDILPMIRLMSGRDSGELKHKAMMTSELTSLQHFTSQAHSETPPCSQANSKALRHFLKYLTLTTSATASVVSPTSLWCQPRSLSRSSPKKRKRSSRPPISRMMTLRSSKPTT